MNPENIEHRQNFDQIEDYPTNLKIVIVGDSGTGKSSILQYLQEGTFQKFHEPTVGVDMISIEKISKNTRYKFNIWDTAGQEKFNSMITSYCKGCDAILYIFSVNNENSFNNIKNNWIKQTEKHWTKETVCMILGNKADMNRTIDQEEIVNLYEYMNILYVETSVLTGSGIHESFELLINMILAKKECKTKNLDPSITLKQFGFDTSLTIKQSESSLHYTIHKNQNQSALSSNLHSINKLTSANNSKNQEKTKSQPSSLGRAEKEKLKKDGQMVKSQPSSLGRSSKYSNSSNSNSSSLSRPLLGTSSTSSGNSSQKKQIKSPEKPKEKKCGCCTLI